MSSAVIVEITDLIKCGQKEENGLACNPSVHLGMSRQHSPSLPLIAGATAGMAESFITFVRPIMRE
jgi:hypothetical protein